MKNTPEEVKKFLAKAGRKGGKKTAKRGKEYYREIGKKGLAKRYNKSGENPLTS